MLYIKYIIFCLKVLWNLRHFKEFMNYDGTKGKSYRIEQKQIKNKIRMAQKKGLDPKKEHVFLDMFYETVHEEDSDQKKEEMVTLFCLLFLWWSTIEISNKEE
tara:strand:+ start:329 stop:637 length:309 start_codon:yes stop_codon:yes gene_type:complete